MRVAAVSLLAVSVVALACTTGQQTTPSTSPTPSTTQAPAPSSGTGGARPGAPGGAGARPRPSPAAMDTMRRGMVARMLSEIAGRENEPAGQVFKNVKMWKELPARAFLDTMNAYGRALGMTCTGCHINGQWASDDRQNKKLAREMQAMVNDLNEKTFAQMNNVDADYRRVTCAMCHRGSGHPAQTVSLDAPAAAPPAQRPPNE